MANNQRNGEKLALGLGLFSIGVGLWEALAPRCVAKTTGMKRNDGLLRVCGARELAAGVGMLAQRDNPAWLKARVAGDAMDLVILGAAMASPKAKKGRVLAAAVAVAGVAALDIYCLNQLNNGHGKNGGVVRVVKSVIINRPAADLYRFWTQQLEDLPKIMNHVIAVERISEKLSAWKAKGPAGTTIEWVAETTENRPNELIAWRSLEGADLQNSGEVRFEPAPGGRGTLVRVEIRYAPPGGGLTDKLAHLFGEAPGQQMFVDLRRFKQLFETGEIARTEGQSAGRSHSTSRKYDDFVRA